MSRRIITTSLQAAGKGAQVDRYTDRVLKYIPADVVAFWKAANDIINRQATDDPNAPAVLWAAFMVGLFATAIWIWRQTSETKAPKPWIQTIVSTAAFAVWAFALGGPFETLGFYKEYYGSLLLIAFTLISGRIIPN